MKSLLLAAAAAVASLAAVPAAAQDAGDDSWTGFYAGVRMGYAFRPDNNDETVLFDTNLDGTFGDQVRTGAGADAFSTGFCGGAATSPRSTTGCGGDRDGYDLSGHVGFDYDLGSFVVGVVGDYGRARVEDSVTAFSTTPASYTLTRRLRDNGAVRARVGFAFGDTLAYGTGGIAYGKFRNSFATSNAANAFTTNGNSDGWGYRYGGGIEQRVSPNFSIGAVYLYTSLKDDDFRVRTSRGTAPATNPFILVNPNGTDFARSSERFKMHSATVTASFRF